MVTAAIGIPDDVLISTRDFPGHLIAACRLLRADRHPAAELTCHNRCAAILEFRARATADAIKEKIAPSLNQTGRANRLDHATNTDYPIAVQVLMETGLERFQSGVISRHQANIGDVVAAAVGAPDRILTGARIL